MAKLLFQLKYFANGWKLRYRPTAPQYLTFFVTGRCNASCPQCFYTSHNDPARAGKELTLDEIERFTRNLRSLPVLLLSGGEPTLRRDLADIVRAFYRNAGTRHVTLPTNGFLPERTESLVRASLEGTPGLQFFVQLSVDEIGAEHDRLRGVPGGFEKLLQTCELLQRLGGEYKNLETTFCLTFSAHNQDRAPEIFREIARLTGCSNLRMVATRGQSRDPEAGNWDVAAYERAISAMFDVMKERAPRRGMLHSLFLARQQTTLETIAEIVRNGGTGKGCLAGRVNAVLDELGNVYPCELRSEPMGNIRESGYSLETIFASATATVIRSRIRAEGCQCTHETNVITQVSFDPAQIPKILRRMYRSPRVWPGGP
jgi:MoaA/NifB/PqqE/SkfB family radical SAM enzyme